MTPIALRVERTALLLLALLPATGLVGLGLLLCGWFSAQRALALGGVAAVFLAYPLWRRTLSVRSWPSAGTLALVIVLILAFLLRWPPSLHVQGGQDQGVYMSMAAHFVASGNVDITDHLRSQLTSTEAVTRYDSNNRVGVYEPGISIDTDNPGRYFSRFYHLHPLWMGIFGGMAGLQNTALSQLFFAIVSLFFACLLAARLARDWRVGIAYAGMLAILPLHVFFSKFPISEMPTLAFALMGVFAMLLYHQSSETDPQPRWLILASLSFLSLFLTRISGFIYLPLFLLGAVLTHAFVEDSRVRRHWHLFWLGTIGCYGLSVAYGLIWCGPYAREIYSTGLGPILFNWISVWLPGLVASILWIFFVTRNAHRRSLLRNVLLRAGDFLERFAPLIFLCLVSYGLFKSGLLAFTDHYRGHPWYDARWHSSHAGLDAIAQSAMVVAAKHLSPVVALLLPLALWRAGRSAPRVLLVAMILVITAYTVVAQWFTPYQYYYARYLLSEAVPLALLLVALRCGDWWQSRSHRPWLLAVGLATAGYCAWFTLPLAGFREADGAEASLAKIASHLDRNDILLVDANYITGYVRLSTPLRLWFGKQLYIVKKRDQLPAILLDLKQSRFADIYFLGANTTPSHQDFALVDNVVYSQRVMAHESYIPRHAQEELLELSLYRLDADGWISEALKSRTGLPFSALPANCCTGVYPDRVWTDGNAKIRNLRLPSGHWKTLALRVHGYRPDYDQAQLEVSINGRPLRGSNWLNREIRYDLDPLDGQGLANIEIKSTTFVPREVGIGMDIRNLGIDVDSLRLE